LHTDDRPAPAASRRGPAYGSHAGNARRWQRSLRWQVPPAERRTVVAGLVIGVLMCILQWLGFGLGMHPAEYIDDGRREAVQVQILEVAEEFPIPPEPEPPAFEKRISKVRVAPPDADIKPPPPRAPEADDDALRARIGAAGAPSLRVFNPDGSIRLAAPPPDAAERPTTPQEKARVRWAEMQARGENPLDCKRTRFAQAWTPDVSAGDAFASKYLKYIGLADPAAIAHRAEKRAERAAEGCDP
jgi:hypothetical protein